MRFINPLDIVTAAVILLFMVLAGRRGLVKSLYGLASFVVSVFLANIAYPYVGIFLRNNTRIADWFVSAAEKTVTMPDTGATGADFFVTKAAQNLFISGLDLPDSLKFTLMENNRPDVYDFLRVTGLTDYITGFLANMMLNILSIFIAFIIIYIAMKLIGRLLDALTKLPLLSALNRLGGLMIGFLQGVLAVWLIFTLANLFLSRPYFAQFMDYLEKSNMAATLYDSNVILHMVTRIVPM